jgi:hypothetical protein
VVSRRSTTFSTISKTSILSLYYSPKPSESGFKTLPLSIYNVNLEKIDSRLLEKINSSSLRLSIYDIIEIVNFTAFNEEIAPLSDQTDFY